MCRGAAITNNTGGVMTLKEETGTIFVSGMNNGIGHVGSKLNIYGGTYQAEASQRRTDSALCGSDGAAVDWAESGYWLLHDTDSQQEAAVCIAFQE